MNPFFLRLAVAAALSTVTAAYAATPPAPPAPGEVRKPSGIAVVKKALREFQDALEAGPHLARSLEGMLEFQHMPDTARLLQETLGSARPWRLEKIAPQGGNPAFRLVIPALERPVGTDGVLRWQEFAADLTVDKSGRRLGYRGRWPEVFLGSSELNMTMRELRIAGDQRLGKGRLWYGPSQVDVAGVDFVAKKPDSDTRVGVRDIRFTSQVDERPKTIDLAQRLQVGTIAFEGEEVKNLTVAYRLNNLDKQSVVELMRIDRRPDPVGKADIDAVVALFRQMAGSAVKSKSALVVERVSAEYMGHALTLSGKIELKGVRDSDFDDPKQMLKRVEARFEIAAPVALVKAVSLAAARRQLAAAGKGGEDPQAMAQTMTDVAIGKLLGEGYARLEDDVLRTTVLLRGGELRVNGKVVKLPTPPTPVQKQPEPVPPVPTDESVATMPARQITGSCTLPDYPREVVEKDAPLSLTLSVLVDDTGTPGQARIDSASAWPDYDARVAAAFGSCRYIPALFGDAPVAQPLTVTIAREPGSVRP